ncbi:MAG TPA: adenylate/guanylate cyclase domain-containing protein [bacterium]|nr:adenylate/guanylate cyclase domain-containing protein [bacterium]
MEFLKKRKYLLRLVAALVGAALGIGIAHLPFSEKVDLSFLDLSQRYGLPKRDPGTVIVALDEKSFMVYGWPIGRELYAALIMTLHGAGAKRIGFDLFFADGFESCQTTDESRALLEENEDFLGQAAAASRTVLASFVVETIDGDPAKFPPTPPKALFDCRERDSASYLKELLPGIVKHAPSMAHVHTIPSTIDGVNRRIRPCRSLYDGCVVDLASAMTDAPLDPVTCMEPALVPFFRSYQQFPHLSMVDILEMSEHEQGLAELAKVVKDKYVVIGATDQTLKDVGPTPLSDLDPLVVTHANRIEGLLAGIAIRELPPATIFLLSAAVGLAIAFLVESGGLLLLFGALWAFLSFGVAFVLFKWQFLWVPVSPLFLPAMCGLFAAAGYVAWHNFLFNQMLSQAFDNYVSPEILGWLRETGGDALRSDSAERRDITILFSDIAGYTTLSNALDADTIMRSLRFYLDRMLAIIQRHNGYVDKINGDGLMVLFGAPKHSDRHAEEAVTAAREMQEEVARMQEEWRRFTDRPLRIRVGVARGRVFVGNLGGTGHIEYTAIGQDVNLAARLESASEIGGVLVSSECYTHLAQRPPAWPRTVHLKGYADDLTAYQLPPLPLIVPDPTGAGRLLISAEGLEELKERPAGAVIEIPGEKGPQQVFKVNIAKD